MRRRFILPALAFCLSAASLLAAGPAQAADLPVNNNWLAGFVGNANNPGPPPGANDYACRSAEHPDPVILVHGTFENQADNWAAFSPYLKNRGYCVFTLNYGAAPGATAGGTKTIESSAAELGTFIDSVLARTGASKVDLVGHSQGGLMPRYYIKFLGGGPKIDKLIGLAPSNHGTTLSGLADLAYAVGLGSEVEASAPGAAEQAVQSPFTALMNTCPGAADADICPGDPVSYTVIATSDDEVVTPYTHAFLEGATNITVQKVCPQDLTEHLALVYDSNVEQLVANALDPAQARPVKCSLVLPYFGG